MAETANKTSKSGAETAKPTETPQARADVRPAESSDPAVQKLLADRQTAEMNGDEDAIKRIDDKIANLAK